MPASARFPQVGSTCNQNGVYYSYDPSRMAKEIARKQVAAAALYSD